MPSSYPSILRPRPHGLSSQSRSNGPGVLTGPKESFSDDTRKGAPNAAMPGSTTADGAFASALHSSSSGHGSPQTGAGSLMDSSLPGMDPTAARFDTDVGRAVDGLIAAAIFIVAGFVIAWCLL